LSKLFTDLGYDVHLVIDANRETFTKVLGDFNQSAAGADAAIFYYAGHGLSLDGHNYLIPVDSDIERATDVRLGAAVDAEVAIDQALSDAKVKLVFLDACRNNPFIEQIKRSLGSTRAVSVSSGLSEMKSGEGTLIAFSTAPGQTALDGEGSLSPFAEALLKNLGEPGLEVRLAMTKVRADVERTTGSKQTPWESTNLTGFYYFKPPVISPAQSVSIVTPDNGSTSANTSAELDLEYWRSVKDSTDPILLQSYITKFPNGVYRALAESRVRSLTIFPEPVDNSTAAQSSATSKSKMKPIEQNSTKPQKKTEASPQTIKPESAKVKNLAVPLKLEQKKRLGSKASAPTESTDMSRFLSGSVLPREPHVWTLPSGAQKLSDSGSAATIRYKGRQYRCVVAASGAATRRARCSSQ